MKSLVVTEKPSVARSIADVVGAVEKKTGYFDGEGYLVGWCLGHLVETAPPGAYEEKWEKWRYEDLPIIPKKWKHLVKENTRGQYEILCGLMHRPDVDCIVCATDAGREGELIFRLVYEMAGCGKPVKRLWISSMEEKAIRDGFDNLRPECEYDLLYASALCRQRADWLVGLNSTRLFTVLYGSRVMKVGRVQTPTLSMVAEREEEIRRFQKERYFSVHALCGGMDAASGRMGSREEAEEMAERCRGRQFSVEAAARESKSAAPPALYDLTMLQRDANRIFGFTAKQTLEYTQSLYEKKLVTYPRTDSRFLSDDMEQSARKVIEAVYQSAALWERAEGGPDVERIMDSRKVTDHHAIIPTAEIGNTDLTALPETERKILYLIENRLLCAAGEGHLYERVRVKLSCGEYVFCATGKSVLHNGWKDFEDGFKDFFKIREEDKGKEGRELPGLSEGQVFEEVRIEIWEHETAPPKRFTEDTLLSAMERAGAEETGEGAERRGLGTPATRADIIEKLVKDGYIRREKKRIVPTEDGIRLVAVLPDIVKSPKLTADWENALALVAKGELAAEDFMAGIENMVSELVHTYHEACDGQKEAHRQEQKILGTCPNCGGQVVKGKFGAYCRNKCGMNVGRVMGMTLTDGQVKGMLEGKKTLVKGLKGKKGSYDAYLISEGVEEYSYSKDGKEIKGFQYKVKLEFPRKKK